MEYKEELKACVEKLKQDGYKSICFYHPVYNIGGGPLVELKIADYLTKNTDLNVYYATYKNSLWEDYLKEYPDIKVIYHNDDDIHYPIREKCIYISNSTRAILCKNTHSESKFFFWHYETVPCAWEIVFIDGETKKFLKLTKDENAMSFHDWSSRNILNQIKGINYVDKNYLYITIPKKEKECTQTLLNNDEINICFISRLAHEKIESLFYLIRNLAKYKTDKKKNLYIIGDGYKRDKAEKYCKQFANEINIIFTGSILREDLDDFLIEHADIVFGVGTCCLEAAALKIPSGVLIMDTKSIDDDSAFWLYNSKEYCVGITKKQKQEFDVEYTKFDEMFNKIYIENYKKEIGDKCYNYYIENHSNFDKLVLSFIKMVDKSTLTFNKLKKCIKWIPYNRLVVKKYRIIGLPIFKMVSHVWKTYLYILGIRLYKISKIGNVRKHYLFGIRILQIQTTVPYRFPTAFFNDKANK